MSIQGRKIHVSEIRVVSLEQREAGEVCFMAGRHRVWVLPFRRDYIFRDSSGKLYRDPNIRPEGAPYDPRRGIGWVDPGNNVTLNSGRGDS